MNRTFHLAVTVLFSCCAVFSFTQTTTPPPEQKPVRGSSIEQATRAAQVADAKREHFSSGPLEVLSDTKGVDLGSYLQLVEAHIRSNWHNLIPASARAPLKKKGNVIIEFAILKNGNVAGMKFDSTSGDVALDRAAWGSITGSNPYRPLPTEFRDQYLKLRFTFHYNPDRASESGIKVSISPPDGVKVPVGGSEVVVATVTGSTNIAVKWSVTGSGCSDSTCGTMDGDMYLAPKVLPSPPSVVLTATSEADSTVSSSVRVQLVQPDPSR